MTKVYVRRGGTEKGTADIVLDAGKNLITGENDFVRHYKTITTLEADLLLIASSVSERDNFVVFRRPRFAGCGIGVRISPRLLTTRQPHYKKSADRPGTERVGKTSSEGWRCTPSSTILYIFKGWCSKSWG